MSERIHNEYDTTRIANALDTLAENIAHYTPESPVTPTDAMKAKLPSQASGNRVADAIEQIASDVTKLNTIIKATYDEPTALYDHAIGDIIYMNGHFYKVTVAIEDGQTIEVGTNITADTGIDPGTEVMIDKIPGSVTRKVTASDVVVDNTGTSLNSTTAQGAIVELDSSKQAITDNSLNTTSKTVPGAINELNASLVAASSVQVVAKTTLHVGTITIPFASDTWSHDQYFIAGIEMSGGERSFMALADYGAIVYELCNTFPFSFGDPTVSGGVFTCNCQGGAGSITITRLKVD